VARAVTIAFAALLALTVPAAAEQKTFTFDCRGGSFAITATLDPAGGADAWSKDAPAVLTIAGAPAQTLLADPDAPDADSFRNKDYEFYSLGRFITLTHKSHGVIVKVYDRCRVQG
jgi:hypothetical protein